MSILQRRFALIRRYVLGVLLVVPLFFMQGAQPQAAMVQVDGTGRVTSIDDLTVTGVTYDIVFDFGSYNSLFGGVVFPDAQNIVGAILTELNVLPRPLIAPPGTDDFFSLPAGPVDTPLGFIPTRRGSCNLPLAFTCNTLWGTAGFTAIPMTAEVGWAVPTVVSPVPLLAALPLFGSALPMLGIVGWRRKRRGAA